MVDKSALVKLASEAEQAAWRAYCPYSGFHVGAAVLADGRIFTGCNVENASLGLTVCAERVAIFSAVAAGCREILAIAICCPDVASDGPISLRMPCGACRQVMAEFGGDELRVLVRGVGEFQLVELLQHAYKFAPKPDSM